jgi:hypothetical protein
MVASGQARVLEEQVVFAPGLVGFQMPLVVPGLGVAGGSNC